MRILLVEDDTKLATRTAEYLEHHDLSVELAEDGKRGFELASQNTYDLLILDWMLPEIDGLELCKKIRQQSEVPIIMFSARAEDVDRIVGLELGADDYVTKPFNPRELLARIRAVFRRRSTRVEEKKEASALKCGPLHMDRDRRILRVWDQRCALTAYQFDLLWVLLRESPRVVERRELYIECRKFKGEDDSDKKYDPTLDRSIDVHMSKVRQALSDCHPDGKTLIQTVRGVGYFIDSNED